MMAGITALVLGFWLAPKFIRRLSGFCQPERGSDVMGEIAKKGGRVPTMGGLLILVASLASSLLWVRPNTLVLSALLVYVCASATGLWDDWRKVAHGDGISEREKSAGLTLSALAGAVVLLGNGETQAKAIEIWVPFLSSPVLTADMLPLWAGIAVAVAGFWVVTFCSSNAVNLTDGIDGLSIGCVITTLLSFGVITYLSGHSIFARYLKISPVPGAGELLVLTAALLGGCVVFLWHNSKPAAIYMGDVGSLGLGGYIGAMAFICNQPLLLPIIGGVFVVEAGSALAQRIYFKRTRASGGKGMLIFKMTPLHHHFQTVRREGALLQMPFRRWADEKIVVRFWLVSLLCGILGLATLKLR
ncbi:MAG: phospho-N-acetylmuramoyl-pentapeptide-transferase [Puniceicoccales bacterium]|nr:phospho-N-acetylmuramoyl-pentapeptide-transferase [Puniceicoccales bacterium]